VVVGTKSGELVVYDIAASAILSTYSAHTGAVWGVHVRPDGRGLVSASADKDVKFWDFEMKETDSGERIMNRLGQETVVRSQHRSVGSADVQIKTRQLTLVHVRTLKLTDQVMAVKYSPDGRFLAVALLDMTVKIFFVDTLKLFIQLYGHRVSLTFSTLQRC
jgi:U3 small nucleolar RNA-associated protein 12